MKIETELRTFDVTMLLPKSLHPKLVEWCGKRLIPVVRTQRAEAPGLVQCTVRTSARTELQAVATMPQSAAFNITHIERINL